MSRPSYQKNKDHPFLSNNIIIILTISFYNEKYNYVRIYRSSIFRPDLGVKNMILGVLDEKKSLIQLHNEL